MDEELNSKVRAETEQEVPNVKPLKVKIKLWS